MVPNREPRCGRSSSGRAPPCQGGGSEFEPRRPLQTDKERAVRSLFHTVPWPSGKARVCKTLIRQFKSGRYLQTKRTSTRMSFLFGENRIVRFEPLNVDVRWTSARTRQDGFDTMIFYPSGIKCSKSGRYPAVFSRIKSGHNVHL